LILTTREKYLDLDWIKDGIIRFGKTLKLMQETLNLLKDEFLTAYERNAEFKKVKFNKSSLEEYSGSGG
jgi:hypothetical protein